MFDFFDTYPWLLPIVIFFGRICDVTLGTLRIIFVSKGEKNKAPIVGFFEVFIWVVIISQVFANASSLIAYIAYAGGYAAGNYVGILVEKKIAFGYQIYRIYAKKNGIELTRLLNKSGFGSTMIRGVGSVSEVDIIETVISRKNEKAITDIINEFDPETFYVVEDIRTKQRGVFSMMGASRLGK